MADGRNGPRRTGPVERAAAVVPPPSGRGFRFITLSLLAISTAALVVIAIQLFLMLGRLETSSDLAAIKSDVASLKTEVAGFHGDTTKAMTVLEKSTAEISDRVNTANLAIGNLAVGLAKR